MSTKRTYTHNPNKFNLRQSHYPPKDVAEALERWVMGDDPKQIARDYHVTYATINKWVSRYWFYKAENEHTLVICLESKV